MRGRLGRAYCVTAYVGNVRHRRPIPPGSLIEVRARIVHTGRTSMHVVVTVSSAEVSTRAYTPATTCVLIFVAKDADGRPDPGAAVDSGQHARTASSPRPRSSASTPALEIKRLMLDEEYTAASTAPRTTLRFLVPTGVVNFGGRAHGGTVMRWIDEAAYACAVGWVGAEPLADHAIGVYSGGIHFLAPVRIGDLVEVDARHHPHRPAQHARQHPRLDRRPAHARRAHPHDPVPERVRRAGRQRRRAAGAAVGAGAARGRAPARACARDRPPARDHRADRRFADARAVVRRPDLRGERRVCARLCVMRISVRRANTRRSDRDRQDGSGCRGRRRRHPRRRDRDDRRLRPRRAAGRADRRADRAGRARPHDRRTTTPATATPGWPRCWPPGGCARSSARSRASTTRGSSTACTAPARSSSSSCRRATSPSASAPPAPASARSSRRPASARARRGQGDPQDRRPRLRARVPDPRRLRADQRAARPTAGATSSTARPRATSGRSWRPPRPRRSCRSTRSCRSGRSIPRPSSPPASSSTASSRWASASGSRTARSSAESTSRAGPSTAAASNGGSRSDHPHQPRRARGAHRRRHPRGRVREPRHRRADAGRQLPARRPRDHPAHRERHARHGAGAGCRARRPRPHQRRQAAGDRAARRRVLPPRRLVRHDARRPPRRLRARRVPGVADRRPRELVDRRARRDPRRRRRDGPRDRREAGLRDDGPAHQDGRVQARRARAPTRSPASAASPASTPTTPSST